MRFGIMQPYFFPYIGYFSLIDYVDRFIFFDTSQYIRHGWVNRNRILGQGKKTGGSYITVPIKNTGQKTVIKDVIIAENIDWRNKIYGQLTVYKRKAPYYKDVICFLHSVLDQEYENRLSDLNIETLKAVCDYIGIERKFSVFSQMNLNISGSNQPDEWALYITEALGGDIYVNPPGGQNFFEKAKYKQRNIGLEFLKSNLPEYIQKIGYFEPGLSIIDVMMYCGKKEIKDMLQDYTIL